MSRTCLLRKAGRELVLTSPARLKPATARSALDPNPAGRTGAYDVKVGARVPSRAATLMSLSQPWE
jgi:hypothetical protein